MHILYVYADNPQEWNCSEWRCAVPARAINRSGLHSAGMLSLADFASQTPAAQAACMPAEVIVVQRNLIGDVLIAMQHWKARGKTIVVDFDDAYDRMEPSNPAYPYWVQGQKVLADGKTRVRIDPPPLTQFKWGLRLAHGATTPSLRLAGDWQSYTSLYYLPNYIDLARYQNVTAPASAALQTTPPRPSPSQRAAMERETPPTSDDLGRRSPSQRAAMERETPPTSDDLGRRSSSQRAALERETPPRPIVIGWGGSLSHLESFHDSGVMSALQQVCQVRHNVKVMISGNDRRIFQSLPLPSQQKILHPWMPYDQWSSVLAQFDIGIAPLAGPYDERRSWIKVLEYMVMKIPWIASDGPAYYDLGSYGRLVENTTQAWRTALLEVVDHLESEKMRAAGQPYLFGLAQSVDENVNHIVDTYAAIRAGTRQAQGRQVQSQAASANIHKIFTPITSS